jgi:hypothetical protein
MNRLKKAATLLPLLLLAALPCYANGLSGFIYVIYAAIALVVIYLLSLLLSYLYYRRVLKNQVPLSLKIVNWLLLGFNVLIAFTFAGSTQILIYTFSALWLVPFVQVLVMINATLLKPLSFRSYTWLYSIRTFLLAYFISELVGWYALNKGWGINHIISYQLHTIVMLALIAYFINKYLQAIYRLYQECITRRYCIGYSIVIINFSILMSIYCIPAGWGLLLTLTNSKGGYMMSGYNPAYFLSLFGVSSIIAYITGAISFKRLEEKDISDD